MHPMTTRKEYVFLFVIVVLGFLLRIWNVGGPAFADDEFLTAYAAKGWVETGKFVFPGGVEYPRAPVTQFLIGESIRWFGFSEWAARLPSVIFSTLTILVYFFLGKKMHRFLALPMAMLVAFMPWFVSWGKEARDYAFGGFLYPLLVLLFLAFIQSTSLKKKILLFISFGIVFFLSFYSLRLSILFLTLPALVLILFFWDRKKWLLLGIVMIALVILFFSREVFVEWLPGYITQTIDLQPKMNEYPRKLFMFYPVFFALFFGYIFFFFSEKKKLSFQNISFFAFLAPFLTLTFFLDFYGNRLQYLFIFFPFFLLLALETWRRITERLPGSVFFPWMLPAIFLTVNVDRIQEVGAMNVRGDSDLRYYHSLAHPAWKFIDFLKERIDSRTAVITTQQFAAFHYLHLNAESHLYFVRKKSLDKRFDEWVDVDEGASSVYEKRLSGASGFFEVLGQYEKVYFVADSRFDEYHVPDEVRKYIKNNFRKIWWDSTGLAIYEWLPNTARRTCLPAGRPRELKSIC